MKMALSFGLVVGTTLAGALVWLYQSKKNSPVLEEVKRKTLFARNRIAEYGQKLKKTIVPERQGPHGETLYLDMYDRHFYEDMNGRRIYLKV